MPDLPLTRFAEWRFQTPRTFCIKTIVDPSKDTLLVVSAHAADFVWRAGGAIALYHSRGVRVRVLCLSFGERGESQKLWRQPDMDIETVKRVRREEAKKAAVWRLNLFFDAGIIHCARTITH